MSWVRWCAGLSVFWALGCATNGFARPWTESPSRIEANGCVYTARPVTESVPVTGTLTRERAEQWLTVAAAQRPSQCPVQLTRVRPEWRAAYIPTLSELRATMREVTRVPAERDWDEWPPSDDQHLDWWMLVAALDGAQLRAQLLARLLAQRGFNVHKLFAIGALTLRYDEVHAYDAPLPSIGENRVHLPFVQSTEHRFDSWWGSRGTQFPRTVLYRPAPVVLVRLERDEPGAVECPDHRASRCALRVLDQALYPRPLQRETDDELGVFSVARWLDRMRSVPANGGDRVGVSLEFGRRTQVIPMTLFGVAGPSLVEVADSDDCPMHASDVVLRAWGELRGRHGIGWRAESRRVLAVYDSPLSVIAGSLPLWRAVIVEGVDEPLWVPPRMLSDFVSASRTGARVRISNGERGWWAQPARRGGACEVSAMTSGWLG